MNELIPFAIIAAVALIFGISFFFTKKARIKRKLKKAPLKRISSFYTGEIAKIVGSVEFVDEGLRAPLSDRQCAYYHIIVEKKVSSGKNSHWKTIIEEEVSSKYLIREGNSYAYVKKGKLKSYIVKDRKYSSGFLNDATAKLENYLKKHGHESENLLGLNKTIRYKEGILERGEKIAVYGKGHWATNDQLDLPAEFEKILVITAPENDDIYISDDPDTLEQSL